MNHECPYCAALDRYNLEPAKPVLVNSYFMSKVHKEPVTCLMHKERNGVSFSLGIECKNQKQTQ